MTLIYTLTIHDTETGEDQTAVTENLGSLYRWESNIRWKRTEEGRAERLKRESMARHPSNTGTVVAAGSLWGSGQGT
jgi:hypothetical protein